MTHSQNNFCIKFSYKNIKILYISLILMRCTTQSLETNKQQNIKRYYSQGKYTT